MYRDATIFIYPLATDKIHVAIINLLDFKLAKYICSSWSELKKITYKSLPFAQSPSIDIFKLSLCLRLHFERNYI